MRYLKFIFVVSLLFLLSGCVFPFYNSYYAPQPLVYGEWEFRIRAITIDYPKNSSVELSHPDGVYVFLYTPPDHNDGQGKVKLTVKVSLDKGSGSINLPDSYLYLPSLEKTVSASKITEVTVILTPRIRCLWGFCRRDGFDTEEQKKVIQGPRSIYKQDSEDRRVYTNYFLDFDASESEVQIFHLNLSPIVYREKVYEVPEIKFEFAHGWSVVGIP